MWIRDATVGDLRNLHEETKEKSYVSSLDWIATGAFMDWVSLTAHCCFPGPRPSNRLMSMTLTDG